MQGKVARHFWNAIIKKGSEVEDQSLGQSDVAQCSLVNQLLMHHRVDNALQIT